MMLHAARCNITALFRTPIILSGLECSVQDTATIFHANLLNSSVIRANGDIDVENTAMSNVAKNNKVRARTT